MHPITTTVTLGAAVATGAALAQARGSAGALTLNGSLATAGVVTLDAPRRIIVHSAGNDTGITFTVTGTARPEMQGVTFSETIAGANAGDAATTQDFATVTSITSSAAAAGNVSAGTNSTGSGPWVVWDQYMTPFNIGINGWVLSGAPTWQVDYTRDDPFGLWLPSNITFPRATALASLNAQVGNADGGLSGIPVRATRLTLVAVGSVQLVQMQQGN